MRSKLFWIYPAILIFVPLAFGTVERWSLTVMESLSLLALLLFLMTAGKNEKNKTASLYRVPGIIPLFCLWTYFIIQIVPLPAVIVNVLSPETYRTYAGTTGVFGPVSWISLSLQKKATLVEFLRFSSYAAFYILTVQLLAEKKYLRTTVNIVVIFSALLALSSILKYMLGDPAIFWIRQVSPEVPVPFGPFVNRNHYAGLMGMLIPVVLSIFFALKPTMKYGSLRERITGLMQRRGAGFHILACLAAVIMAVSVFLSRSKGGIISISLSTLILVVMLYLRMRRSGKNFAIVLVPVAIVLVAGMLTWEPVLKRFVDVGTNSWHVKFDYFRLEIWKDCLSLIKDFILTGTGFGSFVNAFPKYRSFSTELTVDHAHNDYLEFLSEGGITAFLLAAWFFAEVFYKSYKAYRMRKDSYSVCLYIGCLAGVSSIFFFSVTDFNLHIGSNGLYFFFLCGLAVSAAHTRLHEGTSPSYLKILPLTRMSIWRIAAFAVLVITVIVNAGIMAGESVFSPIRDLKVNAHDSPANLAYAGAIAERASIFDPLEARYRYAAGVIKEQSSGLESLPYFKQTVALDPLNSDYLQRLGIVLSQNGELQKGDMLMKAGVNLDQGNPARYKSYVLFLISKGDKDNALAYIKKALVMSPDRSDDFIMLMMLRGMSDEEIMNILPQRAAAHLAFGNYLALSGKNESAEKAYRDALYYASMEKNINKAHFDKVYRYYMKRERFEEALTVMKQATAAFPNDGDLYFAAGTLYEKLGMSSLAVEQYRKAMILAPLLVEAGKRIEDINAKTGRTGN